MFVRPDGKPLKILVRGDCTCRRSIALNPDLFQTKPKLVQNEKSPLVLFLDALKGISISRKYLEEVCDVPTMSATLQHFYLGQAARSIIEEKDADLLMMDSYADMNFELWENDQGAKFWIHPAHLRDRDAFLKNHRSLGRRSLQQSVEDAVELIGRIRENNPGLPVLFLNQQTDYYPKLDSRLEYYDLGRLVAERVGHVYFGGVEAAHALELADVGSCGPGRTLHFQGTTYRRMLDRGFGAGLGTALAERLERRPAAAVAEKGVEVAQAGQGPTVDIRFEDHSVECIPACSVAVGKAFTVFASYFQFPELGLLGAPRFTPMLIPMDDVADFDAWEAHIKTFGKGARLRQKRKAIASGYYTKPFAWRLFIPDIYEANNSKAVRSGGEIRQNLLNSIEALGGAPTKKYEVVLPKCRHHWRMTFGVFMNEPGHMQGNIEVGERLVGYISLRRTGEVALYGQILGHGDHLNHGVLTLLHHEVIQWISSNRDGYTQGLKYVMYGGVQNGGPDLFRFKHQAGFSPYQVRAFRS